MGDSDEKCSPDPDLMRLVRNLAVADARRDHLIATDQRPPDPDLPAPSRSRGRSRRPTVGTGVKRTES